MSPARVLQFRLAATASDELRRLRHPEENILFDINDFDETLPGVDFTVDLKRLAASVALAALAARFPNKRARAAAATTVAAYRLCMGVLAKLSPLEIRHNRIDLAHEIRHIEDPKAKKEASGHHREGAQNGSSIEGGRKIRTRMSRPEIRRTPRTASSRWSAYLAGDGRHLPGLDGGRGVGQVLLRAPGAESPARINKRTYRRERSRGLRPAVREDSCLRARALGRPGRDCGDTSVRTTPSTMRCRILLWLRYAHTTRLQFLGGAKRG
jgi:hypothetical protein